MTAWQVIVLAQLAIPFAVSVAEAQQSTEELHFNQEEIAVYDDADGVPSNDVQFASSSEFDLAIGNLIDYDENYGLLRIEFAGGRIVWFEQSAFDPVPATSAICSNTTRTKPGKRPRADNPEHQEAASRFLFPDDLCAR